MSSFFWTRARAESTTAREEYFPTKYTGSEGANEPTPEMPLILQIILPMPDKLRCRLCNNPGCYAICGTADMYTDAARTAI